MEKFSFFFDTADAEYIREKWAVYSKHVDPQRVLGVTTNPSAFSKEGLNTFEGWKTRTTELCKLVTTIRGDFRGSVHVQLPSDFLTEDEVITWREYVVNWGDGQTGIAIKIPPYEQYLSKIPMIGHSVKVNVTGISDCITALACAGRGADFVSIIPGRMEEVGIPAKEHVLSVMKARPPNAKWELITGSMRTLEGLKWCVEAGTVPTIGKRVLDLIMPELEEEVFGWSAKKDISPRHIGQSDLTEGLSKDFFLQMNELGRDVAEEFTGMSKGHIKFLWTKG